MKEKEFRQYRSNQGRSPERMETSYKVMGIALIALLTTILISLIFNLQ